jgi:hypothetical protein
MVNTFKGVNMQPGIGEGEFADMKNITNDYFPCIGTRKKRGVVRELDNPQGVAGGDTFTFVDDDKLYYRESYICDLNRGGGERQIVQMGALVIVFPDGIIYNTSTEEIDYVENEVTTSGNPTFNLCKIDGTNFTSQNCVTSNTAPSDHSKYWIDTSADPVVMKMYSDSVSRWVSVGTTYVKVSATGIGEGFSAYDAAEFSGVNTSSAVYNNWNFNQNNIIYAAGDDYLIIAGLINLTFTNSQPITVKRKMPEMDYVCELHNRLYGCSSANHEIYASKLGDPKNWYCYAGLDSDSYAATVGTQDEFTGIVAFQDYVMFFKESGYHKLYGTKPSNFQLAWFPGKGVQIGSTKSIVKINNGLMFKAREGICIYDGAAWICSDPLGAKPYYEAVAGAYRNKYFVSMRDDEYRYRVFVYDTQLRTWCIEDDKKLKYLVYAKGALYIIDDDNGLYMVNNENMFRMRFPREDVYPMDGTYPGYELNGVLEDKLEWLLETRDIGCDSPFQKYLKRLDIRIVVGSDAKVRIETEHDSSGDWQVVSEYFCTKKRSLSVPVYVQRCDHVRLRFSGFGEFKLFSISKIMEDGSDV